MASSLGRIGLKLGTYTRNPLIGQRIDWRTVFRTAQSTSTTSSASSLWPTRIGRTQGIHVQGLFEKCCKGLNPSLENPPEQQLTEKILTARTTAFKQYGRGADVQSDFKGYTDEVPSGDDYVGPVEIRHHRERYGDGGRGLFATRDVKVGELLLVSNPLAVVRHKVYYPDMIGSRLSVPSTELISELGNQIRASKCKMAQLYSLFSSRELEMDVPLMDLFLPGSEGVSKDWKKLDLDVDNDLIRGIVLCNATTTRVHMQLRGCDTQENENLSGIWALPSFANHSCSPNVVQESFGSTLFFRASANAAAGEELTVSYLNERDVFDDVETRQEKTKEWFFICKCERCLLEETLEESLSKIRMALPDLLAAAEIESRDERRMFSAVEALSKVTHDVERVIHSQDPKLRYQQQGWIRATFMDAYMAELQLSMDEGDTESVIGLLRLVFDSLTSVTVTPAVLKLAAKLLLEVEQSFAKDSHMYWLTLDRVLGVYEVVYGELAKDVLGKLIRS